MTPEQATALVVALTALVAAVGTTYVQVRKTHSLVDGRMAELLLLAQLAAKREGELEGRDWATRPSMPQNEA